jgi:hypothetical protein
MGKEPAAVHSLLAEVFCPSNLHRARSATFLKKAPSSDSRNKKRWHRIGPKMEAMRARPRSQVALRALAHARSGLAALSPAMIVSRSTSEIRLSAEEV